MIEPNQHNVTLRIISLMGILYIFALGFLGYFSKQGYLPATIGFVVFLFLPFLVLFGALIVIGIGYIIGVVSNHQQIAFQSNMRENMGIMSMFQTVLNKQNSNALIRESLRETPVIENPTVGLLYDGQMPYEEYTPSLGDEDD